MLSEWNYDKDFAALCKKNKDTFRTLIGKNVLITGATGLIGTCVTEFLLFLNKSLDLSADITALSSSRKRLENRFRKHITENKLSIISHDVREPLSTQKRWDYIIHAASIANPKKYLDAPVDVINVTLQGTKNILDLSRTHQTRMVYVSSVEVYGNLEHLVDHPNEKSFGYLDPFKVRSSYAESKRLAETLCMAYHSQYNVNTSVARLSKIYGPSNTESDSRVMAYMLNQAIKSKDLQLSSDGSRIFSFCYVTDAAAALILILLAGEPAEAYNVADEKSTSSLRDIALIMAKYAKVSAHFGTGDGTAISKDTVVDSGKLQALGWNPLTSLSEGLRKQYEAAISR